MIIRQISGMDGMWRFIWRSSKLNIKTLIQYSPINVYLQKISQSFIAYIVTISLFTSILSRKSLPVQSQKINTRKRCEICSKLTIKTTSKDVVIVSLLLSWNIFHNFFYCFYCWLWTGKCLMSSIFCSKNSGEYNKALKWRRA